MDPGLLLHCMRKENPANISQAKSSSILATALLHGLPSATASAAMLFLS
jgi:hypothetical protein